MKAMEKQPTERYNSAAEMLSDIEHFRLNPSIVFDYGKSFVDHQPTKFVPAKHERVNDTRVIAKRERYTQPDDDFEEDEEFKKEKTPASAAVKGIAIAAILVCVIFFVIAMFKGCSSAQAKDVDVPDFVGQTLVEAKENNEYHFQFEIKSEFDEDKELGVILEQEPAANSMKVKTGSTITLTVNGTDTTVSTPFVTNYSEEEAVKALEEKNLIPEIVYVENGRTPKGYVNDTFPKAGVKTTIGSTVYVYVANGKRTEKIALPSVEGIMLSDAKSELETLGLTVEVIYDDNSKELKDTILSMSPLQYGKVDEGSVVTLTVSSGLGDKKTVSVYVDLPTNTDSSVDMTVIIDGVVDPQYSKTLVPKYNKTCTLEITGSGSSNVVVNLDDQVYRQYSIDFTTSTVTTTATYDYVLPTTPIETPPNTEYPTSPDGVDATQGDDSGNGDSIFGF
jgi:serine/threonine-protein kinase